MLAEVAERHRMLSRTAVTDLIPSISASMVGVRLCCCRVAAHQLSNTNMPVTRTVEWRDPFASANDHPIRIHVSNNKAAFPELYKVASAGVDGVIRFPPSGAIAAELLALAHLSSISPYLSATDQKTAALWLFQAQAYGAEG